MSHPLVVINFRAPEFFLFHVLVLYYVDPAIRALLLRSSFYFSGITAWYTGGVSGPMVWYQKFEYAIGHWLQKSTEHVLGCVLCSPGCFSLFRASAIMDDNVMKTYAKQATKASQYVQYDQGTPGL